MLRVPCAVQGGASSGCKSHPAAFAVAQSKRASIMPEVPTLTEAGMTGYDAGIWIGLLAPTGTPPATIGEAVGRCQCCVGYR